MIERYCAWHKPAPILLERIEDGRPEIRRTDGLCSDCLQRELGKNKKSAPGPGRVVPPASSSQERRTDPGAL